MGPQGGDLLLDAHRHRRPGGRVPVDRELTAEAGVATTTLPAGRAVQVMHAGSYDSMTQTYDRLMAWVRELGLAPAPMMWETYLTEPTPAGDPDAMRTLITWPLQG